MIQAAVDGAVDFRQIDPLDYRALKRLKWLLDGVVANNERQQALAELQYYTALMQTQDVPENYNLLRDKASSILTTYLQSFQPGAQRARTVARQQEAGQLCSAWEQVYGRLDDPETQRGIRETVEGLKKMRQEKTVARQKMAAARQKLLSARLEQKRTRTAPRRRGR